MAQLSQMAQFAISKCPNFLILEVEDRYEIQEILGKLWKFADNDKSCSTATILCQVGV